MNGASVPLAIMAHQGDPNSIEYWRTKYETKMMECAQLSTENDRLKTRLELLKGENTNLLVEKERLKHAAEFMDTQLYRKRDEIEKLLQIVAQRHGGQITQPDPCIPLTFRLSQAMGDASYVAAGNMQVSYNGTPQWHQPAAGSGATFTNELPPSPNMPELEDERLPPPLPPVEYHEEDDEEDEEEEDEELPPEQFEAPAEDMPALNSPVSESQRNVNEAPSLVPQEIPQVAASRQRASSGSARAKSKSRSKPKAKKSVSEKRKSKAPEKPASKAAKVSRSHKRASGGREPVASTSRASASVTSSEKAQAGKSGKKSNSSRVKTTPARKTSRSAKSNSSAKKTDAVFDPSTIPEDAVWDKTDLSNLLVNQEGARRIFKCTTCTKVLTNNSSARRHAKNHLVQPSELYKVTCYININIYYLIGKLQFPCSHTGCPMACATFNALKEHIANTHTTSAEETSVVSRADSDQENQAHTSDVEL